MEKEMNLNKKALMIFLIVGVFVSVLSLTEIVQANKWYCLTGGQSLPPGCSGSSCRFTCNVNEGGSCGLCTTNNGYPGVNPLSCTSHECTYLDGDGNDGGGIGDVTPPNITINNPEQNFVFGDDNVVLNIDVSEVSYIEYQDLINWPGNKWKKICGSCTNANDLERFNEGFNSIRIRATDRKLNRATEDVSFFVDSRAPRIKDIAPRAGFANGNFLVDFDELNPRDLTLHY